MLNPYSLLLSLGIVVGMLWIVLVDPWLNRPASTSQSLNESIARIDLGLVALAGGLSGARLAYVITHWEYYGPRPQEWLWFWQGGLPWVGALFGSLLLLSAFSLLIDRCLGKVLDIFAIPALIVGTMGWLGCWLSGCAYGYSLETSSLVPQSPDYFGVMGPRWPTQLVGALLLFGLLLALNAPALSHLSEGVAGSLALLGIALSSFALSFTRADPVRTFAGLRADTIGSALVVFLGGICIMVFTTRKKDRS